MEKEQAEENQVEQEHADKDQVEQGHVAEDQVEQEHADEDQLEQEHADEDQAKQDMMPSTRRSRATPNRIGLVEGWLHNISLPRGWPLRCIQDPVQIREPEDS